MSGVEKAFELSVVISAIDKLSGPMKAMEASMKYTQVRMDTVTKSMKSMGAGSKEIDKMSAALNKMARVKEFGHISDDLKAIGASSAEIKMVADGMEKLAVQQERMAKLNGQMKGFTTTAVAGGVATAGGIGMADGIIHMLNVAGEFQTKLTVVQDLTGSNDAAMAKFGDTVMSTSAKVSKFNDMQVAGFGQQLASGGFPKLSDVDKLLLPVSQFAEVQQYEGKQSSPEEAVKQAIGMAHTFKHYDPESLTKFLDTFNKYSVMQPGSSSDLEQTLTYLAPVALRQMHMKESDVMALAAIDNRIGLNGSHGGTNSADMILRLIPGLIGGMPTAKKTPKAYKAMEDLGLIDGKTGESKFFKNGEIVNLDQLLNTLVGSMQGKSSESIATDFHDILGMQGGRAAGVLGDQSTIEQLKSMQAQLKVTKEMQQIQEDIRKTPQGQLDALKSNSMSLMLRVAQQLGYALNPLLEKMNAVLEKMLAFSQLHPAVAKYVGTFMLMSTGLLLVAGPLTSVIGLIGMLGTAMQMMAVSKGFADAAGKGGILKMLGAFAINPITLAIIALAAAAFLIYKNWSTIGPFLSKLWKDVEAITMSVWKTIGPTIMGVVNEVWGTLKNAWGGIVSFAKAVWPDILKIIQYVWPLIRSIIGFELNAIWIGIKFFGTVIWATMKAIWTVVSTIIKVVWAIIKDEVKLGWDFISNVIKIGLKLLTGDWSGAWDLIKKTVSLLWTDIKKLFTDGWKGVEAIGKSFGTAAMQWGGDIVKGLIKGITGMWDNLKNTVGDLWDKYIKGPFTGKAGIHSPSKVMMDNGKYIVQGLAMGMTQNAKMVETASGNLALSAMGAFTDGNGSLSGSGGGGDTHIHVYPHAHQSISEIVDEVERRQGKRAMRKNMNTGVRLAPGSF